MLILLLLSILCLFVICLFSYPKFSPIPYFPTNKNDLPLIIKALDLKNNQIVYDLGAGDGTVIFAGAHAALIKKLNTKFIAVEINPVLILILYLRKSLHPNGKNIKIVWGDFFNKNFKFQTSNFKLISLYLYASPWLLDKIATRIKIEIPTAEIVSYMYPIKSLKKKEKILKGKNGVYVYN